MGPFIKDVIKQGGGGFAKRWSYLIRLFIKSDDEGGSKISDGVFYERSHLVFTYTHAYCEMGEKYTI